MPEHQLFVIHSFRYDGSALLDLLKMLRERPRFNFHDHSIPEVRKYRGARLKGEIRKRIERADVVLAIARPATKNSDHIKYEFGYAARLDKPIVAIVPPGLTKVATFIREKAVAVVPWDADEIVYQIRYPGRSAPRPAVERPAEPETEPEPALAQPLRSDGLTPKQVLRGIRDVDRGNSPGTSVFVPPTERDAFSRR